MKANMNLNTLVCVILAIRLSFTLAYASSDGHPKKKLLNENCADITYPLDGNENDTKCNCKCRNCPDIDGQCPYGIVQDKRDPCRCCDVCANGLGEYCDPDSDTFTEYEAFFKRRTTTMTTGRESVIFKAMSFRWDPTTHHFGSCGAGMRCKPVKDLPRRSSDIRAMSVSAYLTSVETVCVCKDDEMVCGSDGVTYDNRCEMKKAEVISKKIINEDGPGMCKGAPDLVMSPSDVMLRSGDRALLHCQFASKPVPKIDWRRTGSSSPIPGDDVRFIVHQHGGPEKFMITTWLDIHNVTLPDADVYECRGSNMYGMTTGSASVFVKDDV